MLRRRMYTDDDSEELSIDIQNNTQAIVPANVLGNETYANDLAGQTTQYQWNLTGFSFSTEVQATLQYRSVNEVSFKTLTLQLSSPSFDSLLQALNQAGLSAFFSYTQSGSFFITTYSDYYVYGQLFIDSAVINPSFSSGTGFDFDVVAIAVQSDGKILCGGIFASYNGNTANRIIRLNSDGSIDASFNSGTGFSGGGVATIFVDGSGRIYCGGAFTSYNGTPANRIIRLNANGTVDGTFVYGTGFDADVSSIDGDSAGNIVAVGSFTDYNGTSANGIISILANGSVDGTFVYGSGFVLTPFKVVRQPDGRFIVAGGFSSYNGTPASRIIRLLPTGAVDGTFIYGTGFDSTVFGIFRQSDGKILAGGFFTSYNGTPANRIVRLLSTGAIDPSFVYGTGFDAQVNEVAQTSAGFIVAVGFFTTYQGVAANTIVAINDDGSNYGVNYGTGFDVAPDALAIYSAASFLVAGAFTSFDGQSAPKIISLLSP